MNSTDKPIARPVVEGAGGGVETKMTESEVKVGTSPQTSQEE